MIVALAALFVALGGTAYAVGGPVVAGPHGDVTIESDFAGLYPLTLKTPQYGYGALVTKNYQGKTAVTIDSDGMIWSHATGADKPRLFLSANGYEGEDVFQTAIGSSVVSAISPGGEIESYNYYVNPDEPRFSVRDRDDNLVGGIDGGGKLITLAHAAPDPRDLQNGEARIWFDQTPTTGGLRVTAKFSDGSVRTMSLG